MRFDGKDGEADRAVEPDDFYEAMADGDEFRRQYRDLVSQALAEGTDRMISKSDDNGPAT